MEEVFILLFVAVATGVAIWRLTTAQHRRSERELQRFRSAQKFPTQKRRREETAAKSSAPHATPPKIAPQLRPLDLSDYDRFAKQWKSLQEHFIDDPSGVTVLADRLIAELMRARGYAPGRFEQRVEELAAEHPRLAERYRIAREAKEATRTGEASTERLRHALLHYRSLFQELLVVEAIASRGSDDVPAPHVIHH